jgi:hypothetical protein
MNDELKPNLTAIIKNIVGSSKAVTADALAQRLGLQGRSRDRKVRLMIEDLIFLEFQPILATTGKVPGYFSPETWSEWQEYDRVIKERVREICKRKAQVKKNVYNHFHGNVTVRMV